MNPFTDIAPYYDQLMADINYSGWFSYIQRLLKAHRSKPSRVLDLACGTGTLALIFHQHHYQVEGLDLSASMLEVARRKARERGAEIPFHGTDMRDFTLNEPVDLIVSVFDSLNYLISRDDLSSAFKSCYKCLNSGGLLIFDMNTPFGLGVYATPQVEVKDAEGMVSIWRMSYQARSRTAQLSLTLFVEDGDRYRRIDEIHEEKGYLAGDVEDLLQRASFSKVDIYAHMTLRPAYTTTKRMMVVARR